MAKQSWKVYILRCADGTLYTGITTDLARREQEHNSEKKGARYTRSRRPVVLVYSEEATDRSEASKREYAIKQLPLAGKLELVGR
jgi:putative endonuclease